MSQRDGTRVGGCDEQDKQPGGRLDQQDVGFGLQQTAQNASGKQRSRGPHSRTGICHQTRSDKVAGLLAGLEAILQEPKSRLA